MPIIKGAAPHMYIKLRQVQLASSTTNALRMAIAPSTANAPDRYKLRSRKGEKRTGKRE